MFAAITDALFPVACPGCGCRASPVCDGCLSAVRPAPPTPPPTGIDTWAAPFAYEGVVRELIARMKYRDARYALAWLARQAATVASVVLEAPDAVTWAPTTRVHRRERGFDHAALLARRIAGELQVPCRSMLRRVDTVAQTGRPARARRDGPRFELTSPPLGCASCPEGRSSPPLRCATRPEGRSPGTAHDCDQPRRVLVVDDVATTGATLRAAALALRRPTSAASGDHASAASGDHASAMSCSLVVDALTVARTPPPTLTRCVAACGCGAPG